MQYLIFTTMLLIACNYSAHKDLVVGEWVGYYDEDYKIVIKFYDNSEVEIFYENSGNAFKGRYDLKNDFLYIDGIKNSKLELKKNSLRLKPLLKFQKEIELIHAVEYKRK